MHAEVTAYKGRIVIELKALKSIPGEVVSSVDTPRLAGQVIKHTGKHLGVSKEALALLKSVPKSDDDAGEVDWSRMDDGTQVFGWKGGRCAIFTPQACHVSRKYRVGGYVTIPNEVPEGARRQLDALASLPLPKRGLLAQTEL